MSDHIMLKWGTVKGWKLSKPADIALANEYNATCTSASCMAQHDTPEQKEILCRLIRQHEGHIFNDWDGEDYTKEAAVDYIMNYGR